MPDTNTNLQRLQGYFRSWARATERARLKFKKDFEYTEGNGHQWAPADKLRMLKSRRPALEFNHILPQVEFVSGTQRDMALDLRLFPRSSEDIRLSEIATAALKAAMDYTQCDRISGKVFDDATICGLGVWEVLHTFDDAEDLIWGDIVLSRINPLSFIYDPWSTRPDLQDGAYMGKAEWVDFDDFVAEYPQYRNYTVKGDWLADVGYAATGDTMGTAPTLLNELWDQAGRIRVLTMWDKRPVKITVIVDERSGTVQEMPSKKAAEEWIAQQAQAVGTAAIAPYMIETTGTASFILDQQTQMPVMNPATGQPQDFISPEMAQAHLDDMSRQVGMEAFDRYSVVTRQIRRPHWTKMIFWQVLDEDDTPHNDRSYPFVPYISRQFSDDPDSIMGITRNLIDPQDEINKRRSNILAHLTSSSHSGWLNRKAGGANRTELEQAGSAPGVVIEYSAVKPDRIEPAPLSNGHFEMMAQAEKDVLRISGVNAEMVGQTTQQTVSGRAIQARQSGGVVSLRARFENYKHAFTDLGRMLFSRVQQYYPAEKLKRIIGILEQQSPMGPTGMGVFQDPVTGLPADEEQILQYLQQVKNTEFDLAMKVQQMTNTEREALFQRAQQVAQLVVQTGRMIGPATFAQLIEMADMPAKLAQALKIDTMQPPVQPMQQTPPAESGPPANGDGAPAGGNGESAMSTPNRQAAAAQREGA